MVRNERPETYFFPRNSGMLESGPVCLSPRVGSYQGVTIEDDCLHLAGECDECKSTWREVFTLTLFEDVRVSDIYKKQEETRATYSHESLLRAYQMYEEGSTHFAVMQETGLDRESAKWIARRQLAGLGLLSGENR
jgi:hypothetical protein